MLKRIKLTSLKPNPYRNFDTYKLRPDKLDALAESIEASGFWGETVVARPATGGGYELAFGHHRWQAAMDYLGKDARVEISVRDLDNDAMLKMMARENNEVYDAQAAGDIELVQAAIQAHVDGEITLPPAGAEGRPLKPEDYVQNRSSDFTSISRPGLGEYLALGTARLTDALGALKLVRGGTTTVKTYTGMSPAQGRQVTKQTKLATAKHGPAVGRKVAHATSTAIRKKSAIAGGGGFTPGSVTVDTIARDTIRKETGANVPLLKFRDRFTGTASKVNTGAMALHKLVIEMIDMGVTNLSGPEVKGLNEALDKMRESLNAFDTNFPSSTRRIK